MKTITAAALADQLWNTVVVNDAFDPALAPVEGALREVCSKLVGYTITESDAPAERYDEPAFGHSFDAWQRFLSERETGRVPLTWVMADERTRGAWRDVIRGATP